MWFNKYRNMWVMVFFDLPTDSKKEKKAYVNFRKILMKDGFSMFQFSIYLRHCSSRENMKVHVNRIKNALPSRGKVGILSITDKQFEMMEIFEGKSKVTDFKEPPQMEFLF